MNMKDALMSGALGRLLLRTASVTDVVDVAKGFRRIHLEGEALRGATFVAGDKLQLHLPGIGMRTYTPLHWDADRGATTLLAFVHGDGPGATWASRCAVGDVCRMFGPRRSIPLANLGGPWILVGDETSFALARAARITLGAAPLTTLFEADDAAVVATLAEELGLVDAAIVARTPGDHHHGELARSLGEVLDAQPDAALVMTGRASTIQALRAALGTRVKSRRGKTKAYWATGRVGLD